MKPRALDDKHIAEFRVSGLTDETVAAARLYSAEGEQVRELLGFRPRGGPWPRGWVVPFGDPDEQNRYCRFKPDYPRTNGRSDKPIKYESPLRTANRAYFPPGFDVDADTIVLTEGEKKSLAATQAGFNCIGLIGILGWQTRRGRRTSGTATGPKTLIDDLNTIPWHGKRVFIVFDSDGYEKPEVRKAANELAAILDGRGARVSVLFVPAGPEGERRGIDDFLVAHGDDGPTKLQELLDAAGEYEPHENAITRKSPMDVAAQLIAERFTHMNIPTIRYHRAEFCVWDGRKYRRLPTDEFEKYVMKWLDGRLDGAKPRHATDIAKCVGAHALVPFTADPPVWLGERKDAPGRRASCVVMANGILDLDAALKDDDPLRPHSPLWFSEIALPYRYDPTAKCESWLAFLRDVFDGDKERIDLLQEWFGYLVTNDTRMQSIALLEGPRRSGKGTTCRMLQRFVGDDNVVAPRLSTLGDLFGLWPLMGKKVAICPDAHLGRGDKALGVLEVLKSISGEDAIDVHRKHMPSITCRLGVRFTLAVSELPRFGDSSNALASRLLILPYRNTYVGREDRSLDDRLAPDVGGVLNWSLAGLRRLR